MNKNTGVLCKCGGTMNPIRIDTEYGSTEYQCELCKNEFSIWLDMFRQDASPQDNNICECGHPKSAHIYESGSCRTGKVLCYCTNYKAKFSKDNNGMVPNEEFRLDRVEVFGGLAGKEMKHMYTLRPTRYEIKQPPKQDNNAETKTC